VRRTFVYPLFAAFVHRLLRECGDNPEWAVARAWLLAFGRPPERKEAEHAATFLRERTAAHGGKAEAALAELCLALFNANEFAYVV
jgi:hypothetical protein